MKGWRLYLVLIFVILAGAALFTRLFFLQIWNHKFYAAQALGQNSGFTSVQGERGEIFFENSQNTKGENNSGEIKSLAINRDKWTLSAKTAEIADKNIFAKEVAEITGDKAEAILEKINPADQYVAIKKGLLQEQIDMAKSLNLKGLYWEKDAGRYYPQENMLSQVVGFVGGDDAGQYGLEGYYENMLKGKTGIREDRKGLDSILSESVSGQSLNGSSIYLTVDYNIQFQAEALLKQVKSDLDIKSGQILVLKPDSGRVLAMANYPSFNPNSYSKETDLGIFQNSAVQKIFEPGSIMKPFTMAIALNEGRISPESTFTDSGSVKIGPDTIYNFDKQKYGEQTMSGILEKSINTGAVFVSQQVAHKTYFDYLEKFGFTKKTGIDLQGEAYSSNEALKNGHDMEYATSSFGQGIGLTPIQIARAFCMFANGGKLVSPYIVEKISSGIDESKTKAPAPEQVITANTASQVTEMMKNVVERGFGSGAKVPGYYLAGKTGTAQVPYENKKGYYEDKTIQSFIGFGPVSNPQFLILVKLDDPKVPKSSLSAAPVFKKLAQYIINYWQIPPDYNIAPK